jgi:heme/copper-type cytochrome/quinol oxidase subunit 2
MKRQRSVFKTFVTPIVMVMVSIPTLAISIWKVLHGRGAESYSNVYGLTIHYTSVLILVVVVIAILGVAYLARIVHLRRYGEPSEIREQTPFTGPADSK